MDKELTALDIQIPAGEEIKSDGTAYYRLPKELREFFIKCEKENEIIGFSWDGSWNFGVILKKK